MTLKNYFPLLALLAGTTSLAQAQTTIPAGITLLGGGISYSRHTESQGQDVVTSQFRIAPNAGYFVADNLAVGLNLSYSTGRTTISNYPQNDLDAATALRVGPYVQYYKMLSEQFGFVGTLGAGYQHSSTPTYIGSSSIVDVTRSGYYASLTPGVIFFPVPKFGISASVGYLGYDRVAVKPTSANGQTISDFDAAFGLDQLTFGGTFYFGR